MAGCSSLRSCSLSSSTSPHTNRSHPALSLFLLFSASLSARCFSHRVPTRVSYCVPSTPVGDPHTSCGARTVCYSPRTQHDATRPRSERNGCSKQLTAMTTFASPAVTAQKCFSVVWEGRVSHKTAQESQLQLTGLARQTASTGLLQGGIKGLQYAAFLPPCSLPPISQGSLPLLLSFFPRTRILPCALPLALMSAEVPRRV